MSSSSSIALERGLPANIDAERFVLGSILLDDSVFIDIAGALQAGDFCLEKHQRIFRRMAEIHERGEKSTASRWRTNCFASTNWNRSTA